MANWLPIYAPHCYKCPNTVPLGKYLICLKGTSIYAEVERYFCPPDRRFPKLSPLETYKIRKALKDGKNIETFK